MSSTNSHSPCAACKFLRRKCTQECVFAPYFPPDQPQKFASVHRVYGASNVAKILNEMPVAHREEAVASLAYEAEARLRDPVYGCVGFISYLHARLKQIQNDTTTAKKELATFLTSSPQASMMMMYPYNAAAAAPSMTPAASSVAQFTLIQQQQQQQQMYGAGFEQQAPVPFPSGGCFDNGGVSGIGTSDVVDSDGFPVVQLQQGLHDYQLQSQLLLNNVPHQHQDSGAAHNQDH